MEDSRTWTHFWPSSPALRGRLLECVGAGEEFDKRGGPANRVLSTHQVLFVSRGKGVVVDPRSGTEWSIAAPAVVWTFPGVPQSYSPSRAGWDEHWVLFAGAAATIVEDLGTASASHPTLALPRWSDRISALFAELRRIQHVPGRRSLFRASILVQELLLEASAATTHEDADLDVLQRFTAGWRDRSSISQRARRLGVSVRALRKVVETETGRSPIDLLTEVRLARARSLLLETSLHIGAVARDVGFDDPAYFSRQFSRKVGVSPTMFRAWRGELQSGG